jgi:hypothetical protein
LGVMVFDFQDLASPSGEAEHTQVVAAWQV